MLRSSSLIYIFSIICFFFILYIIMSQKLTESEKLFRIQAYLEESIRNLDQQLNSARTELENVNIQIKRIQWEKAGKPCEGSGITGKCQGSCKSGYSCEEESKTSGVPQCQCQEMKDKESVSEKYTTSWLNSEHYEGCAEHAESEFHHQFNDIERLLQLHPSEANKKRVRRIIKDITSILNHEDFDAPYTWHDEERVRYNIFLQNWEARNNYATKYITWSTGNPYAYNDINEIDLDDLEQGKYDDIL